MYASRTRRREPLTRIEESFCAICDVRGRTVCCGIAKDELGRLAAIKRSVEFNQQHTIFHEGDPAAYVYNIRKGAVRISKDLPDGRRQITGFLYAGDFLGLACHGVYIYTAETIKKTQLCRFARPELEALMAEFPALERQVLERASNELIQAQDQMLLLGRKAARERLASFILLASKRARRRGERGNPVTLTMRREDMADFLGLTLETVSRTLSELRASGVIRLSDASHIYLDDRATLRQLAAGGRARR